MKRCNSLRVVFEYYQSCYCPLGWLAHKIFPQEQNYEKCAFLNLSLKRTAIYKFTGNYNV